TPPLMAIVSFISATAGLKPRNSCETGMRSLLKILSVRYWRRCPGRLVLVIASIALGVAAWVATRALNTHLNQSSRDSVTPLAGAADLLISNGDAGVARTLVESLRRVNGIQTVRPLIVQRVLLPDQNRQSALLLGADLSETSDRAPDWDVTI